MSSASPDPRHAPGSRPTAQDLLARRSWRLRHSIWLLAPILGFGMLTWAAFLYIGTKAKRWDWLAAGALYAIATAFLFYVTDGTEGPQGKPNEWLGSALIAVWAAGIVHALLSNKAWLRWRSQNLTPWYAAESTPQPMPATSPSYSAPLPPQLAGPGLDTQYYAPAPAPSLRPSNGTPIASDAQWPAPMSGRSGPGVASSPGHETASASGQVVDVNTADVHVLAQLPGLGTDRAQRVIKERESRRGFSNVAEFADAAGLAPHEHARVRPHVVCSPPAQGPAASGYGRVLDY